MIKLTRAEIKSGINNSHLIYNNAHLIYMVDRVFINLYYKGILTSTSYKKIIRAFQHNLYNK